MIENIFKFLDYSRSFKRSCDNLIEFISVDDSITISISSIEHLSYFCIFDSFSQGDSSLLEVFIGNSSSLWWVEQRKDFIDIGSCIFLSDSIGHEMEPFIKLKLAWSISIQICDHLENGGALSLETKRNHGGLKFYIWGLNTFEIDWSSLISIKQIKSVFDFIDLIFTQSWLDVGSSIEIFSTLWDTFLHNI